MQALNLLPKLWAPFLVTIELTVSAAILSYFGGLLLVPLIRSRFFVIRTAVKSYIELLRYTPLLVQIYLIYFGLPFLGIFISGFLSGLLAIAMQHAAFFAVIFNSGVEAVPRSQWQAGRAIGMRQWQIWVYVILPQAVRKMIAPIGNQTVVLALDTSLLAAVGVVELTLASKMIVERSAATIDVFLAVAVVYLALTTSIGLLQRGLEKWCRARG